MTGTHSTDRLTLLFDGDCGFCSLTAGWLRGLDQVGRLSLLACQDPPVQAVTELSRSDWLAAAWAIEPSGERHRGAAAINVPLGYSGGWELPRRLVSIRPIRWLEDGIYRGVVWARRWLPGVTPYCQQHPDRY